MKWVQEEATEGEKEEATEGEKEGNKVRKEERENKVSKWDNKEYRRRLR